MKRSLVWDYKTQVWDVRVSKNWVLDTTTGKTGSNYMFVYVTENENMRFSDLEELFREEEEEIMRGFALLRLKGEV